MWDAWADEHSDISEQIEMIEQARSLHPQVLCIEGRTICPERSEHISKAIACEPHVIHCSTDHAYVTQQRGFWLMEEDEESDMRMILDPIYIIDAHIGTWIRTKRVHFTLEKDET
jgi:hypothetical protein